MLEPTLEAVFEEARELLRGKQMQCPCNGNVGSCGGTCRVCQSGECCGGMGLAPNPAYKLLLGLFERPFVLVFCEDGDCDFAKNRHSHYPPVPCLPYLLALPLGALEGALRKAIGRMEATATTWPATKHLMCVLEEMLREEDDTKLPAVQALCEWLKEKP